MATIYDFRNFDVIIDGVSHESAHNVACATAHERGHSVVVETDDDDIYRVTPKGKRWQMPAWFMVGTLGGRP